MHKYKRLNTVIFKWNKLPFDSKPKLIKTFTAGLNHETHLLDFDGHLVVCKFFSHSMSTSIEAQSWAHKLGVAPEVLHVNYDDFFALFDYIDAETLSPNNLNDSIIKKLAIGLKALHGTDKQTLELGDFKIINFCNQYLDNIVSHSPFIADIHKRMIPILDMFVNDPTPWTFCHNDLVAENCFVVDGQAQFIDWEYAQRHNPWFDLAAIIFYLKLNKTQSKLLLAHYTNKGDELFGSTIFYSSQCALLWGDMLWHLDHFGTEYWDSLTEKWQSLQALANVLNINLAA